MSECLFKCFRKKELEITEKKKQNEMIATGSRSITDSIQFFFVRFCSLVVAVITVLLRKGIFSD